MPNINKFREVNFECTNKDQCKHWQSGHCNFIHITKDGRPSHTNHDVLNISKDKITNSEKIDVIELMQALDERQKDNIIKALCHNIAFNPNYTPESKRKMAKYIDRISNRSNEIVNILTSYIYDITSKNIYN